MRKLLNTLHIMTQGSYLHRDGETIAIKVGQELKLRVADSYAGRASLLGTSLVLAAGAGTVLRTRRRHLLPHRTGQVSGARHRACLRQCTAAPSAVSDGRCRGGCVARSANHCCGKDRQQPRGSAARGPRDCR